MKNINNCKIVEILDLSDEQLINLSIKNTLSLSLTEMKAIKTYFQKLNKNPNDIEIETIAQTWSEHCKHKTLTGSIKYVELIPVNNSKNGKLYYEKKNRIYKNLLKETIFKATCELNKIWCLSTFVDNAGIIEFDAENGVAFKVETHNHPSALDPYGGASTGIGGVIRDILGVGLGAKPIANTDVLCFGNKNVKDSDIPKGTHHPKRIINGVIAGIRDYGNKMGIPTVNGAVCFDNSYIANPIVYCGTVGIIPKSKIKKTVNQGDLILLIGGKTGRDGIHGATFSSIYLDQKSNLSAVQIGNPIVEKKVLDAMLQARDLELYTAVTDCGAGGLSSAIGELANKTGALVHIDKIPLKYYGLKPWEIWISESQERMVLVVPKKNENAIIKIFKKENVEAVFIGEFTNDKKLKLSYHDEMIANLDMDFLHNGLPKPILSALYTRKKEKQQKSIIIKQASEIGKLIRILLSDPNVCSKEWIIRQYDHEVQGQTIIKPLQGSDLNLDYGPGDASVIFPYTIIKHTKKGIVLSNGINIEYGKISTYDMATSVIEEALRNSVAVGGNIKKMALLDNFCWGNPNNEEVLGSLVCAVNACYDMSKAFEIPFISGKDSLNNEYSVNNKKYSISPVLLISAIGIVDNIKNTVTVPFKNPGNLIFSLGVTRNELGGTIFSKIRNINEGVVPKVYPNESKKIMNGIYKAICNGLVESCHDCSEGGIAIAISEMAFSSRKGAFINIDDIVTDKNMTISEKLFSESNGRFIIEVKPEKEIEFIKIFNGTCCSKIGYVSNNENVIFESKKSMIKVQESISSLLSAWKNNTF
ncbi:MAG: phosphoribosylformylglycinamidine synthase subunit PurL [Endomicrobium sp.]|jgi:phosphoribosylformylglycinamidine synthase|nr:phosphoribosylformylglycinamidine synthase subunit PurL [Endomicrobium sp.]